MRLLSWGAFRRLAVLEVDANVDRVSSISPRAAGCRRVVAVWERRYVGDGDGTAYGRALAEATAVAADLNSGADLSAAMAVCSADCILPTTEELNSSRNWREGTVEWVDWARPERPSAAEIRTRAAA